MALRLLEGGAHVAYGDGHEFHLPPHCPQSGDEWGVLGGLLLEPLVASEVLSESDLDDDEAAPFAVEDAQVQRRGVRYSSGIRSGAMPWPSMNRASWVSWGSI